MSSPKVSLKDRLLNNSTIKETAILNESILFTERDVVPTPVPGINVALGGDFNGGLTPGVLMIAGPSKHFKSAFCMLIAGAYMRKHKDAMILFYDSEFGTPESYFDSFGIPRDRVVHSPITDIEVLKQDIVQQLQGIERGDKCLIIIDSIGNLASRKEVEDAMKGEVKEDMTRAKKMKSLFRTITPYFVIKDIPLVCVGHTYKTQEMYSKDVVSGGTGPYLAASTIWIVGRAQDKDDDGLHGYHFKIKIEKSRYVREQSIIPITVGFDSGIKKYSGFKDMAEEAGFLVKVKKDTYQVADPETGELFGNTMKGAEVDTEMFWDAFMSGMRGEQFASWVKKHYSIANKPMKYGIEE